MLIIYRHPYNRAVTFSIRHNVEFNEFLSFTMAKRMHVFIIFLCLCLFGVQVLPGYASYLSQNVTRVAFLGLHFEDVEPPQQENILSRISVLIDTEPRLYSMPRNQIEQELDEELLNRIRQQLQKEDLREAAQQLGVDYVFAGNIQNQSRSRDVTALTGEMVRFDVATDNMYSLQIKSFFEDFNSELVRINNQLVRTIVPEQKEGFFKRYLPGILIVAATALAIGVLLGGTKGQSSGSDPGPTPPFTGN